jgi:hypothetical protein
MVARWCAVTLVLVLAGQVPELTAQGGGRPPSVRGRQDLTFGLLITGVATTISRLDAAAAGQFELRGARDTPVTVRLTLPTVMTGPGTVPLEFGPNDGGHGPTATITASQPFDPTQPLSVVLSGNGKYYVFLGGTARPAPQTPSGTYGATVSLTMTYVGN